MEGLRLARERTDRERRIAETLQRSLIDEPQPVPLLETAVAYVPSARGTAVGGDWYDLIAVTGRGTSAGAVGDVMGHGIDAASRMGKLQAALRAFAMQEQRPARVLELMNHYARRYIGHMATLCFVLFDPSEGCLTYALAGHPPPLLLTPEGARYLPEGGGPPLGALAEPTYLERTAELAEDATLLLYTDGLVEGGVPDIGTGLDRLRRAVEPQGGGPPAEVVKQALLSLGDEWQQAHDDIAMLAVHRPPLDPERLELELPARLDSLKVLRGWLRAWLHLHISERHRLNELVIACGEAATNAAMHAYDAEGGMFRLSAERSGSQIILEVSDHGSWRGGEEAEHRDDSSAYGHGLRLMRELADGFMLERSDEGTTVRLVFRA